MLFLFLFFWKLLHLTERFIRFFFLLWINEIQIAEDLHFVLRMRHTFESLGYQSGFYLSQLFSSTRGNPSSSSTLPLKQHQQPPMSIRPPPPLFNWGPRPLHPTPSSMQQLASQNFQNSGRLGAMAPSKDEAHMFILPHSSESRMEDHMMGGGGEHENDIKWPNGLSFFSALTGGLGSKMDPDTDPTGLHNGSGNPNDQFLSLDSHGKMEGNKFKRSFTLPARMATSSSSTSLNHNQGEYRNNEGGMYNDVMETFLEWSSLVWLNLDALVSFFV